MQKLTGKAGLFPATCAVFLLHSSYLRLSFILVQALIQVLPPFEQHGLTD